MPDSAVPPDAEAAFLAAYSRYDGDKRVHGPSDYEAFREAVLPLLQARKPFQALAEADQCSAELLFAFVGRFLLPYKGLNVRHLPEYEAALVRDARTAFFSASGEPEQYGDFALDALDPEGRVACFGRGEHREGCLDPLDPDDPDDDQMKAALGLQQAVPLTRAYIASLEMQMRAHLAMKRRAFPDRAARWTWGVCEIGDLADSSQLYFLYGGDDDRDRALPDGADVVVIVDRFCRVCGCTESDPCPEGCGWVEREEATRLGFPDLCTACLGAARLLAAGATAATAATAAEQLVEDDGDGDDEDDEAAGET